MKPGRTNLERSVAGFCVRTSVVDNSFAQWAKRVVVAIALLIGVVRSGTFADEFRVALDGGSVITVDVSKSVIDWTSIKEDGGMNRRSIPLSQVNQLVLTRSSAKPKVIAFTRNLSQLGSNRYADREAAERQLSNPAVIGQFRSVFEVRSKTETFDYRYRINRILDRLGRQEKHFDIQLDRLTLNDGSVLVGDAGDFAVDCDFRGTQLSFKRNDVRRFSRPTEFPGTLGLPADRKRILVHMYHQHHDENDPQAVSHFYRDDQVVVDFDRTPNGSEIAKETDVNDTFVPVGIRLSSPGAGYIGISGYPFKFAPLPVSGNSICVFDNAGTFTKRFKGITEIRFCSPGQPSVPAGVHEFGLFVARVNHSRDFILEAYNSDDELLAPVEATDRPCVFMGVKSNQPITKVRVLSNPYLSGVDRVIDQDYGIDSICFSPPVSIATPVDSRGGVVRLKNGDILQGIRSNESNESNPSQADPLKQMQESIQILDDDWLAIQISPTETIKVRLDEVQSIRFHHQPDDQLVSRENRLGASERQDAGSWMAILKDGSNIRVVPGRQLTGTFFDLTFDVDDLAGLRMSDNPTRYYAAGDFDHGKRLLVFPTCRIATDKLVFSDTGFEWKSSAKKLQQPLHTGLDPASDQDPTPDFTSVQFDNPEPARTPTVWLAPVSSQLPGTGKLRLTDRQQLILGGENGFSIVKFQQRSLVVSLAGTQTTIPIQKVISIDFPD